MAFKIGPSVVDQDEPPLSAEEFELVQKFHELYYRRWATGGANTARITWFGHFLLKCPLDLWIYQELLVRRKPDVVVETGTLTGGSALYIAMIMDLLDHGEVITVDIKESPKRPAHPRLTYLTGSSVDPAIVARVKERVAGRRAMVVLDSNHKDDHVLAEIRAYAPLVHVDDYLIVEDTNVNGHPAFPHHGPGPMEAIDQFLATNDEFEINRRCERFMMTLNPRGYLRRLKPSATPAV